MSTKQKREPVWTPISGELLRAYVALGNASAAILKRGFGHKALDRRYEKARTRAMRAMRAFWKRDAKLAKGKRS
jgi:hypothetical protein